MSVWTATSGALTVPGVAYSSGYPAVEIGAYEIEQPGLGGLGRSAPSTPASPRGDRDGTVPGRDIFPAGVITIPVLVSCDTGETALDAADVMFRTWAPGVDTTLVVDIDGWKRTFFGRFGSVADDLSLLGKGVARYLVSFIAHDPVGYADQATVTAGTSITLNNVGTRDSDRCELTIVGNGGTPVVTNTNDGGGSIVWARPLAGSAVRVINLRDFTVVDGSGVDCYDEVATASTWFVVKPGNNAISVTGAASVAAVFRPAYL